MYIWVVPIPRLTIANVRQLALQISLLSAERAEW